MLIFTPLSNDKTPKKVGSSLPSKDVPGKERENTGTGKKLERTIFFPFPFLHFLTTFFPLFDENRKKRVKKGVER